MGEILLKQALALAVLLFFGGLMAIVAGVLPKVVDRWESPPEPRGLGLGGLTPSAERRRPAPPPSPPAREPVPAPAAPVSEEPLVAGAIALALTLYHQELHPTPRPVSGGALGASPWALAGRVQTMQSRLRAQKR